MPISAFPPEILSTIFSFLLDPSTGEPSYHKQFAFSQVCQSWRSIALADPTLWRVLKSRNTPPKWVPELIRRARASNLDVELTDGVHPDTLQAIATHFCGVGILRVSQHSLNFASSILHGCVEAISTQELPLRVLEATSRSIFDSDGLQIPTPLDYDLAAIIAHSPRLQKLTLNSGGSGLWGVPLPSSLTTLKLESVERPSLEVFLNVLRQTPNLQHFFLVSCGPKDGFSPLPPVSTHNVDLPRLASVYLGDIHLPTESFFQYLNFPAECVNFSFDSPTPTAEGLPVIRYIADRFQHPEDQFRWPALRQLRIDALLAGLILQFGLSPATTQARNFKDWKEIASQRLGPDRNVALYFHWTFDRTNHEDLDQSSIPVVIQISRSLPLCNLEVLDLKGEAFQAFTPENFTDLLKNLSELVYLEAHVWNHPLWEALEGMQKDAQPPAVGFLPKLRYVRVDLKPYGYGGDADDLQDAGLDWLQAWLTVRAASEGLKLTRLEFAYQEYESFEGVMPEFEDLAEVVLYTNTNHGY